MLRVMIADDEPPARKRLRKLLKPLVDEDRITIAAEAGDGREAVRQLEEEDVDLLFLDIQMPEYDGFEVIDNISPDDRPITVFVTAYDEHALRAFEANAIDYLLKPIERKRLKEAVDRAEKMAGSERRHINEQKLNKLLQWIDVERTVEETVEEDYIRQITVPLRDRTLVIPVSDVISAEIDEGITRLYTYEGSDGDERRRIRHHVVNYTLDQLEENLDPAHFIRVHRSAIVQVDHIKEMVSWFSGRLKLIMTGDHEVVASRDRSRQLKDRLSL